MKRHRNYSDIFASNKTLRALKPGEKYTDYLPCVKHYNAYNSSYNSRERMAIRLFNKIVRAYVYLLVEDMLEYGKYVYTVGNKGIKMGVFGKRRIWMNDEEFANHLAFIAHYVDHYKKIYINLIAYPTDKFRKKILDNVKRGVKFHEHSYKRNNEHKIFFS